jgi:UDP-glucose 4-epimerase
VKQSKILVTGGCGYIGSHVCAQLSKQGVEVIVIDNLSTGYAEALLHGETLIHGDFGDRELLRSIFSQNSVKAIFHFAASIVVEDSVKQPFQYYENNSIKFYSLLQEATAAGVEYFVLSSTAAVYGSRIDTRPVRESDLLVPMSPYGRSKVFDEWLLEDVAKVSKIRHLTLRYFNVAGASANGKLGQRGKGTHLIKVVCETALKLKKQITIFGTDYATKDGTCIRDYIHVEDLASAHLAALSYLEEGGASTTLNCGYNQGYSVKEVITAFEKLTGVSLPVQEGPRRAGDVPFLIADSSLISKTLKWDVLHNNDLPGILSSAWAWEKNNFGSA